ncbi:hypothetical protein AERO9AM_10565 [Aeromicrobium sp. 9AM]|nr:hypothetical protein AERO9AM_10565 [Aeromicrobium sp. 9AM]
MFDKVGVWRYGGGIEGEVFAAISRRDWIRLRPARGASSLGVPHLTEAKRATALRS